MVLSALISRPVFKKLLGSTRLSSRTNLVPRVNLTHFAVQDSVTQELLDDVWTHVICSIYVGALVLGDPRANEVPAYFNVPNTCTEYLGTRNSSAPQSPSVFSESTPVGNGLSQFSITQMFSRIPREGR